MTALNQLLSSYAQDHRNPGNQRIHMTTVPMILCSIMGLLWLIPAVPYTSGILSVFNIAILGALYFYWKLDQQVMMTMIGFFGFIILVILIVEKIGLLMEASIITFILAWIGQLYGHYLEGNKPSFLKDTKFFLIGPLWVLVKLDLIQNNS